MTGVTFIYTNHRGEIARRNVVPLSIEFAANQWYPTPTWLLLAWDFERKDRRWFSLSKIKFWEEDSRLKTICADEKCGHPIYEHYTDESGCYGHHYHGSIESKCYCRGFK